jgi:UDP-N-acetylmuramate--alanine ligase
MDIKDIKAVYFIGAGGIGMSAIARYFIKQGLVVAGYDKTPSTLTRQLEKEGMLIHYEESVDEIPRVCRNPESCLVVYTPAIPADHQELQYFREHHFDIQKRAQVLGALTRQHKGLCVAGTHGKTTTSTMCAHIMHQSHLDCNAFLGGISKNYGTNYILSDSDYVVIEADEFDRSFHWLSPYMTVITSTDPDHLDIYGTKEAYLESFRHYTELIQPEGALIVHRGEHAARFVEHDIAHLGLGGTGDAALADIDLVIARIDLIADLSHFTVDAYPARGDQFFTFSARSNAAFGEHFLQSN